MTPVSRIRYLRHRSIFAARTPDRLDAVTASLAWCRTSIEAIIYPKRSSTRRDTHVRGTRLCTNNISVSPSRLRQHPVCGSLMRVLVPFKALYYHPTGQLWTRRAGTKPVVYVQCSVYVAVRCPADSCETGWLTLLMGRRKVKYCRHLSATLRMDYSR